MLGAGAVSPRTILCRVQMRPRVHLFPYLRTALAAAFLTSVLTPAMAESGVSSVDMIYVDSELAPQGGGGGDRSAESSRAAAHPIYRQLSEALAEYRQVWAGLPQIEIPDGSQLRAGADGERVRLLRERLGLDPEGSYDSDLEQRVSAYQAAHGLPADGIAGRQTLQSLNRGAPYYERLIQANLERAATLPAVPSGRSLLVDAAAARLWMYEDGRPVDSMRVIVGKPTEQTPMLAAYVRHAVVNPYWNVPPDLVRRRVAPNVLEHGMGYLDEQRYEVLSGWSADAERLDPEAVDWQAVADGETEVRVRQLPGAGNSMGDVKFMISGELGIYLHDTPDRHLFDSADRRLSSGCVRLEDASRLSRWLLGSEPRTLSDRPEQRVDLPEPVPVFITYLTAAPSEQGLVFREDVYGRDAALLASLAP